MSQKESLSRISISLPESLLEGLDSMVARRGFDSRSQAICDMVNRDINDHKSQSGRDVMTGTLNLVYKYIDEVISNLSVNLTDTNTMAVLVVQGPADKLRTIADQMISLRGVAHGKLLLNSYNIPPIHPFVASDPKSEAVTS
jgi:CopG family nickel-responsive transcriptional regulator